MELHGDMLAPLHEVVGDMAGAVEALADALRDERAALDAADADALDAATLRKQDRLQQLETLDAERRHLAAEAGPVDPSRVPGWDAMLAALDACRGMNQINGRIVAHRLRHVREAIDLVTGAERGAPLYGPGGKPVSAALNMTRSHV